MKLRHTLNASASPCKEMLLLVMGVLPLTKTLVFSIFHQ